MLPKGGNGKFDAAERTGSVPYPVILMVVMYNWIKRKYMMLNGECMCNQRLFDKGEKAYLCNEYVYDDFYRRFYRFLISLL